MYPPQAGFVPKYGQKLSALGTCAAGNFRGRSCQSPRMGTGPFGVFSLFGDPLNGQVLETQEWGFPDHVV